MEKRFTLRDILPPVLKPEHRREIMETAAPVVVSRTQEWYASKGEDYFDGDNHPSERTRDFMRGVQNHWFEALRGADGFDIYFSNPRKDKDGTIVHHHFGLLLHEYGGTIRAKKPGGALTIPINDEARGLRAAQFEEQHGKLFLLDEQEGDNELGLLVYRTEMGSLIAAYALRRSVTIKSLQERRGHPATPSNEELQAWAVEAIANSYDATLLPD